MIENIIIGIFIIYGIGILASVCKDLKQMKERISKLEKED